MPLSPQIIITGFSENKENKKEMDKIIHVLQKEFDKMGIPILIAPENFLEKDITKWIKDIATERDFYINIQNEAVAQVCFRTKKEKNIAKKFTSLLGQWTDSEFIDPISLASKNENIYKILSHLPCHVWNITLPNHLSEKENVFSIMGCITNLYTEKHSLIEESEVWPFRDVPSSHFAFNAIKKAKAKKIITGYKGDIFHPNGGITRGEVLYMLEKLGKIE